MCLPPLLLAACAGAGTGPPATTPSPAVPATVPPPAPATQAPAPPAPVSPQPDPPPEEEDRITEGSNLRRAISAWIEEHPGAGFDEAARMANRFLRKHGYPMLIDASPLIGAGKTYVRLKAGKKAFIFEAGKELSATADICGERFLRIPARILGAESAALVVNRREYPFSLKGFKRDRFRVFKGKRLVSVLHAPEPTEPIGLSANGKALYMKFFLNEKEVGEWWQRVGIHQPSVLDEDPYLMLRVQKSRLYFDENIEHLPAQEFEVEESDGSSFRWKFQPSGLVLELSSRCG